MDLYLAAAHAGHPDSVTEQRMHPISATLLVVYLRLMFLSYKYYRKGDVLRAVFWLIGTVAVLQVSSLVR